MHHVTSMNVCLVQCGARLRGVFPPGEFFPRDLMCNELTPAARLPVASPQRRSVQRV